MQYAAARYARRILIREAFDTRVCSAMSH
jgi:hypothetical protein